MAGPLDRHDHFDLRLGGCRPCVSRPRALKDVQKRDDKYGSPQYKEYRGKHIPAYEPPRGFGLIDKVRGEKHWTAWLYAPTRFVNDLLTLLGHSRPLFLSLRERKKDRARWVHGMELQTTDPMTE